jgi:uroporphyrinogen-III synthase
VEVVPCYAVVPETEDQDGAAAKLVAQGADWFVFASGLAIEHFHERFDLTGMMARFPATRLALASESVRWALEKLGLAPSAVARPDDAEDLANAIIQAESAMPAQAAGSLPQPSTVELIASAH